MSQAGRDKEGEREEKKDRTQSVFLLSSVETLLKRLGMQGIVSRNMLCCFFKIDEKMNAREVHCACCATYSSRHINVNLSTTKSREAKAQQRRT